MPPVQAIPLRELARACTQELPAERRTVQKDERARILKLITQAPGTTALVKPGARIDPAGMDLMWQPAINHLIQERIGGLNAEWEGLTVLIPALAYQIGQRLRPLCKSEEKVELIRTSRRDLHLPAHGRTRVRQREQARIVPPAGEEADAVTAVKADSPFDPLPQESRYGTAVGVFHQQAVAHRAGADKTGVFTGNAEDGFGIIGTGECLLPI